MALLDVTAHGGTAGGDTVGTAEGGNMSESKTCGECKYFDPSAYMDMGCALFYGVCYEDDLACRKFTPKEEA